MLLLGCLRLTCVVARLFNVSHVLLLGCLRLTCVVARLLRGWRRVRWNVIGTTLRITLSHASPCATSESVVLATCIPTLFNARSPSTCKYTHAHSLNKTVNDYDFIVVTFLQKIRSKLIILLNNGAYLMMCAICGFKKTEKRWEKKSLQQANFVGIVVGHYLGPVHNLLVGYFGLYMNSKAQFFWFASLIVDLPCIFHSAGTTRRSTCSSGSGCSSLP